MSTDRADREIGATEITSAAARVFVLLMLSVLFMISAIEFRSAWRQAASAWIGIGSARGLMAVNNALRDSMHAFEDRLREEAWLTKQLVPPLQRLKIEWLGLGTENVMVGREGWLHYAPDVTFLASRKRMENVPRAEAAIRDFAAQLAARGIKLVLVPVPPKTAHVPWTLTRRLSSQINLPDLDSWFDSLESEHLHVFDFEGALDYLRADSHWTWSAMDQTAASLSAFLRAISDLPSNEERFQREADRVTGIGDLAKMLGEGVPASSRTAQTEQIEQVRDGEFAWQPQPGSPVLLLGDSFSNIFSQEALGWGEGAGLAEQLSFHLGLPIDRIVRNDAGAWATRDLLARELARGRDRLAGVKVVVWQFAARELARGDWKTIKLHLGEPRMSTFAAPPIAPTVWTGTVAAISAIPTPGRVPYADHIAAMHLVDVSGADAEEAYVFGWSMTNHLRTGIGRLRPGERVRITVQNWAGVQKELDGINRSELSDDSFLIAEPAWVDRVTRIEEKSE